VFEVTTPCPGGAMRSGMSTMSAGAARTSSRAWPAGAGWSISTTAFA